MKLAREAEAAALFTTKTDSVCLCLVFMWEKSTSAKFFYLSVSLCPSATRGAVSFIAFMCHHVECLERLCLSPHAL